MSINEVRYLPECGSTNAYMKEHFEEFGPVGAVYTTNQTAGRGRLGRTWVNAEGKALYYTVAIREPLAQPATLPLLASLAVRRQLALQGAVIDLEQDPGWLAEALTDFGFDRPLYTFARDGFAPFREEYKAACVNIGRRVTFDLPDGGQGAGEAVDVDEEGRLVVRTDSGEEHVFTGEVSVRGIYGSL